MSDHPSTWQSSFPRKRGRSPHPHPHAHPNPVQVINRNIWKRSESVTAIQTHNRDACTSNSSRRPSKRSRTRNKEDNPRPWVFSSQDFSHFKDKFTVVSYNILGIGNASKHPDLYSHSSHRFLNWDQRKNLIHKEVSSYKPSILCFQEVDRFSDLSKLLKKDGFEGILKARTGDACDGCAIFWKKEQFTLLHEDSIEFREFDLRDNVAQFCVLKMSSKSNNKLKTQNPLTRSLLVGNIHALYNPKRGDIKLGQVRLLLESAHRISQQWGNIPVVIAGDLNCLPQSAIYQFLASSKLDILLHERKQMSGQLKGQSDWRAFSAQTEVANRWSRQELWSKEELQVASGSEGITHLHHHLQLCSAYVGVPGSCVTRDKYGEPLATSYHCKFMGTCDYIWHSKELVPVGVVETLPIDVLRQTGGLPNKKWGSDHLALVCELAFVDKEA